MFEYNGVKFKWLGHDCFLIEKDIKIVTDPYRISKKMEADLVLISHEHFDHMSPDDLKKVVSADTIIVAANECIPKLGDVSCKEKIAILPGQEKTVKGVKVRAIPAYNITKINPDTKKPFHPKEDRKVGFLFEIGGITVYHTGDSDHVPEMKDLRPDVLLVPVSGTYVMTPKEASEAVSAIKPKVAIPMHFGTIVGSEQDAQEFKDLVKHCQVQILSKE
ncbi:MAG TPA: MBL fold metallo-hydrolase [Candidatus Nitrosotalea sp.]|nr:MBL fold metallo-hydrolase [Candidatus Nitrosotalea sp.]